MSELRALLGRAENEGMNKGLAYRIARASHGDDYLVCVLCGWPWAGANRCVNEECRGFCTWGERFGGEPSSWVRLPGGGWRPRMMGESR